MAFVPTSSFVPTSLSSTFAGQRLCAASTTSNPAAAPPSSPSSTVVARLGTVLGNSSLDKLGLDKFKERFELKVPGRPDGFSADYEVFIQAVYRQIFGNAYIMESERAEMAKEESDFRDKELSVKEFCRALCKTYQYRKRFFDGRPLYGAIELCFKHILGRTPDGLEQYRAKSAVYDAEGYDAMIDSFFDDGEYDAYFDEWCVPFYRGHLTTSNLSMAAFTHMFQVVRGASTSDKANPRIMTDQIPLNSVGIQSIPLAVIAPGTEGATYADPAPVGGSWQGGYSGDTMARTYHGATLRSNTNGSVYRIEVANFSQAGSTNGGSGVILRSRTGKIYRTRNNGGEAKISDFRRANKVYMVPFEKLSDTYVNIHKSGGTIASITPV